MQTVDLARTRQSIDSLVGRTARVEVADAQPITHEGCGGTFGQDRNGRAICRVCGEHVTIEALLAGGLSPIWSLPTDTLVTHFVVGTLERHPRETTQMAVRLPDGRWAATGSRVHVLEA